MMNFSAFPNDIGKREQVVKYTYDQQIIKPPEANLTKGRITEHIIVDSRWRDCDKFPNPNNYVVELKSVLDGVICITPMRMMIPKSGYAVNSGNNNIHFRESGGESGEVLVAVMNEGNYKIDEFLTEIGRAMTAASDTNSNYSASVNSASRKITVTVIPGLGFEKLELITGCLQRRDVCGSAAMACGVDTETGAGLMSTYMPKSAGRIMGFSKGVYCSEEADNMNIMTVVASGSHVNATELDVVVNGVGLNRHEFSEFDSDKLIFTSFWHSETDGKVFCRPNIDEGDSYGNLHKVLMTNIECNGNGGTEMRIFDYNGSGSGSSEELVHQASEKFIVTPIDGSLSDGRQFNQAQGVYNLSAKTVNISKKAKPIYENLYNYIDAGNVSTTARVAVGYLRGDGFGEGSGDTDVKVHVANITGFSGGSGGPGTDIVLEFDTEFTGLVDGSCVVVAFVDGEGSDPTDGGSVNDYYKLVLPGEVKVVRDTTYVFHTSAGPDVGDLLQVQKYDTKTCSVVCEERRVLNVHQEVGEGFYTVISGCPPASGTRLVYRILSSNREDCGACGDENIGNTVVGNCPYELDGEGYLLLKINEEVGNEDNYDGVSDVALGTFDVGLMDCDVWGRAYQKMGDQYMFAGRKFYNPPREKLSRMRVAFYTADGELYDFNCKEHMFCLEIERLNQGNHYSLATN